MDISLHLRMWFIVPVIFTLFLGLSWLNEDLDGSMIGGLYFVIWLIGMILMITARLLP